MTTITKIQFWKLFSDSEQQYMTDNMGAGSGLYRVWFPNLLLWEGQNDRPTVIVMLQAGLDFGVFQDATRMEEVLAAYDAATA